MVVWKTTLFFAGTGGPWGAGLGWAETYHIIGNTLEDAWSQEVPLRQARAAILVPEYQILGVRTSLGVRPAQSEEFESGSASAWNGSFDYGVGHQALPPNFGILLRVQLTNGSRAMRFLRGISSDVVNPVTFQLLVNNAFTTAMNGFTAFLKANAQVIVAGTGPVAIQNSIPWRGGNRKVGRPYGTPRKRSRIR